MGTSNVALLDLRDAPGDPPPDLAGAVVVVDDANSLVKHAETYLSLMDGATSVVCVAVGESSTENPLDGVVLTVPPVLRHATVLWVGDPVGVNWAPHGSSPQETEPPADALDGLVAALRVPEIFDQVVAVAGELPSSAANPGIRLVTSGADLFELASARAAAVRSLCGTDKAPSQLLDAVIRQLDAPHDREGAVLSGPVAEARTAALLRLNRVAELARTLGTPKALFGRLRPTEQLGSEVAWAGKAAENCRRYLAELLNRIDSHLQIERPPVDKVMELGVRNPREARGAEIVSGLRQVVDARLDDGVSLPVLAQELRHAAVTSAPQGCAAVLDEVNQRGPLALAMPVFRRWPLPLKAIPAIVLSCAAVAFLLGPGWDGWLAGGLLATAWFGSGWLLLGRRPGPQAEFGLRPAARPAALGYGMSAAAGVAAGALVAQRWSQLVRVPPLSGQLLILAVVLLSAATVVLSWYSAARHWAKALPVQALRDTLADLIRITEDAVAGEWQPMRRRQAIANAATEVASGLDEIAKALDRAGVRLFVAPRSEPAGNGQPRMIRPVPHEVFAVVRGDLVDLCRGALAPAWPAAETASRTPAGVYAQRLDRLLGEYGTHVRRRSLLAAPELSRDVATREALMARVWSESPAALETLSGGVADTMTQLCRHGQLGYLSTVAEPGLVRFAPRPLWRVLDRGGPHQRLAADPGVVWTDSGEFVGALRLLPLRSESVRQVIGEAR